jgi:hypothetical protein
VDELMPRVDNPNAVDNSQGGQIKKQARRIDNLVSKTRTAYNSLTVGVGGMIVSGVTQLVGGITGGLAVTGAITGSSSIAASATITAGTTIAAGTGSVTTGILEADAGLSSTGVYNTLVTTGSFRTVSVNMSGVLGETVSSRRFKQDIEGAPDLLDGLMKVNTFVFRYINDVDLNGDAAIVHLGGMAEDFDSAGLGYLVDYEEDGITPHGIKYELLAIALLPTIQKQQTRLDELEARLLKAGL